jgi:outer membrane protein OmpA-like peptidoglycan-associated protein
MEMSKTILAAWVISMAAVVGCTAKGSVNVGPTEPAPPPPPATTPPPPPAAPAPQYITISDRIEFETGNDVLLPKSWPVLDQVADTLAKGPHIQLVEIQGHTDDTGDAGKNLMLSENRAKAVRMYLISKGITGERISVRGFGATVPLSSNATPEGREKNRRVQFRIVKQGAQPAG